MATDQNETKRKAAANRDPPQPPNPAALDLVLLSGDELLHERVQMFCDIIESRFNDAGTEVYRETEEGWIRYSLVNVGWHIYFNEKNKWFWGFRGDEQVPVCSRRYGLRRLLDDIEEIKERKRRPVETEEIVEKKCKDEEPLTLRVTNVTAIARLGFKVDVEKLHHDPVHGKRSELRSGTVTSLRLKTKSRAIVMVQPSGALLCAGAKTVQEYEECLRILMPVFLQYKSQ